MNHCCIEPMQQWFDFRYASLFISFSLTELCQQKLLTPNLPVHTVSCKFIWAIKQFNAHFTNLLPYIDTKTFFTTSTSFVAIISRLISIKDDKFHFCHFFNRIFDTFSTSTTFLNSTIWHVIYTEGRNVIYHNTTYV